MTTAWESVRIGDWGEVTGGRQRSPHLTDGSLRPYLRVANVFEDYIDTSDVLKMMFTDAEFRRHRLQPGDILLNEGQSLELVGRSAIYEGRPADCAFQNTLVRFRPGPSCDYRFAQQIFKQLWRKGVFRAIAKQTTSIAHLGVNRFAALRVVVPPIEIQRAIAAPLTQCEQIARTLTRLIDLKREFRRGLTQTLLFGRKRFREFVRSTEEKAGCFGTVPKDWSLVPISAIAHEVKTRGATDGVVVFSCTKYDGLVPSLEYFGKQVFSRDLSNYKRLQAGDFAYATNHIEEGSIGLLRNGQPAGLVSPMYTVFRPTNSVNAEFLFALLKTESYRRVFEIQMNASVKRRGSLRWKEFSRIKIALPSVDEQDRIADTLAIADLEIKQLDRLRVLIELEKHALLSRLLSGEIVVAP